MKYPSGEKFIREDPRSSQAKTCFVRQPFEADIIKSKRQPRKADVHF